MKPRLDQRFAVNTNDQRQPSIAAPNHPFSAASLSPRISKYDRLPLPLGSNISKERRFPMVYRIQ